MGDEPSEQQPVTVRPAAAVDRDRLVEWNAAMALETEHRTLSRQVLEQGVDAVLADSNKGFYLIAECDGQPVGGLLVTYEWSDWRNTRMWWLQSVYVEPDARGKGVFRALFETVRDQAKADNAGSLRLYVERENHLAQKVYEARRMRPSEYLMYELALS
ncbi:MAG: GNAT family N-acetyltransferase [Rhodanobacteraceae bacterium]